MNTKEKVLLMLCALLSSGTSAAQVSWNITKEGQLYSNWALSTQRVTLSDEHAYVASGYGVRVVDISNPEAPLEIGYSEVPPITNHVAIQGSCAYVGAGILDEGFRILDISDPTNPTEIGSCGEPWSAQYVTVSGDYVYVAAGVNGLRIIDASDPTSPLELGSIDFYPFEVRCVPVVDQYAYLTHTFCDSMLIVDVSDPTNPTIVNSTYMSGFWPIIDGFDISGNYLYAAGGDGVYKFDVTDPSSPVEVDYFATPGSAKDVAVSGDYIYVADGYSGMRILDSSNLNEIGYYDNIEFSVRGVDVAGGYACLATSGGLWMVDVSGPSSPFEISKITANPGWAYGAEIRSGYAYVANGDAGLLVIDVSNLTAPAQVDCCDTPGSALDVDVAGDYAYVADGDSGLRVISIASPSDPVEVGNFDTPGFANAVEIITEYAFIADWDAGLRIVDISNPSNLEEVGFLATSGFAEGLTVHGDYAYIADGYFGGLRIVNISDPTAPVEVGDIQTPEYARDVRVSSGYAYIANGFAGLFIVDVSDPANPIEVGYHNTPGYAKAITVLSDNVFIADDWMGLRIFNIIDPANSIESGYYDTPGYAEGIVFSGNYGYVMDGSCIGIYNCSDAVPVDFETQTSRPVAFSLFPVYPNPFNQTTTITYNLPISTPINLSIYDVSGRLVNTLMNGIGEAGTHHLTFNAPNLASGVYICYLETQEFSASRRLVLVK